MFVYRGVFFKAKTFTEHASCHVTKARKISFHGCQIV